MARAGWRELTPRDAAALAACDTGAVLFGRDDLLAIRATGKHRTRFLHAITTQKLDDAPAGAVLSNTLCTAKGALVGVWTQVAGDAADVLWTPRPAAEGLVKALLGYRVAERVKLQVDETLALVEVIGPAAREAVAALLIGLTTDETDEGAPSAVPDAGAPSVRVGDTRVWASTMARHGASTLDVVHLQLPRDTLGAVAGALMKSGATPGCHAARDALRVQAGAPLLSLDLREGTTPLELGLADAVHLEKGCYLGHEALAMQSWRGQLRRHLCWVTPASEATASPGDTLKTERGRRGGWLGSGVSLPDGTLLGLALVQRKAFAPGASLSADGDARYDVIGTTREEVFSA